MSKFAPDLAPQWMRMNPTQMASKPILVKLYYVRAAAHMLGITDHYLLGTILSPMGLDETVYKRYLIAAENNGHNKTQMARELKVNPKTVYNWYRRNKEGIVTVEPATTDANL